MKSSIKKRLQTLEHNLNVDERHRCALVVCDPEILFTFDFSFIDAEHVVILPDNGRRLQEGKRVPKGSYIVSYR
jgi:hypothetical protein